jgi:hypothetical protein
VRRWLNCLLIGVLTCSLSVDTAKACWYLRHAHVHAARGCWRPACPPVPTWPACHDVVVWDSACGSESPCGSVVIVDGWRDEVCCECGPNAVGGVVIVQGSESVVVGEAAAAPAAVAESVEQPRESVVAVEPTPTPAESIVSPKPAPETGVAAVAPAVPELKPAVDAKPAVETVVALEPAPVEPTPEPAPSEPAPEPVAAQPAPAEPETPVAPPSEPTPVVAAVEPPAPPVAQNIFEEVESAADAALLAPEGTEPEAPPSDPSTEPATDNLFGEPAAAKEPAVDPLADPSAPEPALEPATGPAAEPEADPAAADAPAADEPAADEPAGRPAADEPDPFSDASREPLRRWVDDTGSYATVGMLVDVRADGVEIRKANGRTVIVPLERLSEHDRAYAADAEARLVADRTPSSRETAGL